MTSTFWLAAVDEHDEKQDRLSGHPDDLIPLLSIALDEVVVPHHVIRIAEDFQAAVSNEIPWTR